MTRRTLEAARASATGALAGLFLAGFLAFGVGVYAFTQFLNPVQVEFGWNRAVLGGLMSAFWIAAPFVLVAAYAVDFLNVRVVVGLGAALETLGLLLMTHLTSPTEFFAVRFCMGVGKCLIVTPVPIAAAQWFQHRTAMACAVALSGWHFGGLVMAPFSAYLIQSYGWRSAAGALAVVLLAGMAVTVWLLEAPVQSTDGVSPPTEPSKEPGTIARLAVLVLIALVTPIYYAGYATFLSQLTPILSDFGVSERNIGSITGSVAVFAAAGTLLGGALAHKLDSCRLVAGLLLIMAALESGTTMLRHGVSLIAVAALLIPLGLIIGGGDPILIEALRRRTPPRSYHRFYGWWYLACLAAFATAPVLAGAFFDRYASYRGLFLSFTVASTVAASLWIAASRVSPASRTLANSHLQPGLSGENTGC